MKSLTTLGLLALLAAPAAADVIVLRDGTRLEGVKVTAESAAKVEYKQPKVNAPQSRPSAEVRDIEYASTSPDFREGLKAQAEGSLATAAAFFDAAAEDEKLPEHVKATARYLSAALWLEAGDLKDADSAFAALLKAWPDSRHLPAALSGRGQALLQNGDFAEARKAFETLKAEAKAKSLGERWDIDADYHALVATVAGDLKGSDGKPVDAVAGFQAILARAEGKDTELAARCRVQIGRVHLGAGRNDEALPLFEGILDQRLDLPDEVVAGAYNGRGRVLYARASTRLEAATSTGAKGDKVKAEAQRAEAMELFAEARLDFLRVFTQYNAVLSQQAEALFWASQCFINIGDAEADARSKALLRLCATSYPGSTWGQKAKQSL